MGMTIQRKVEQAVLNNAAWCDTVCRSHGCPGEFLDGTWVNRQQTPPYYPNAITLNQTAPCVLQQERIGELMSAGLPLGWGVKDSFATLQLKALGFDVIIEAQWIYKPATTPPRETSMAGVKWEIVTTSALLKEWERAWSGGADEEDIFLPSMLSNQDVAIVAARLEGRVVAGFIANYAAGCVGLSNIFLPEHGNQEWCNDCVAVAQSTFPDMPLVGYESDLRLETVLSVGFEATGDLRVWIYRGLVGYRSLVT